MFDKQLLLRVENLNIAIQENRKLLPVVRDLSFDLYTHETLGIVGESGSGKSLTAMAIMGLLAGTQIRVTSGRVCFNGVDLLQQSNAQRRAIMGSSMAMIFQEPMTSLNPVYRIGDQIIETIKQHKPISKKSARSRALELLDMVNIPDASYRIDHYPHQLSGGQRQRVMIAMALACDPNLLIADEPTTALDVTVQKEVLDLIANLQRTTGTAIILISHDLGVIAQNCDSVAVMYCGEIVESSTTKKLFDRLGHPYTRGLIDSIPPLNNDIEWLNAIPGQVPPINTLHTGCPFKPRCHHAQDVCKQIPPVTMLDHEHSVRCHFASRMHGNNS
ncbi:MAG: ABC transporter ATP-binding protein [Granulosicoccus sp.]